MTCRRWLLATIRLKAVFLVLQTVGLAQQEPATADEVISRYLKAIGGERFSARRAARVEPMSALRQE